MAVFVNNTGNSIIVPENSEGVLVFSDKDKENINVKSVVYYSEPEINWIYSYVAPIENIDSIFVHEDIVYVGVVTDSDSYTKPTIYALDKKNGTEIWSDAVGQYQSHIYVIAADSQNNIYYGGSYTRYDYDFLYCYNNNTQQVSNIRKQVTNNMITSICIDKDDNIYIGDSAGYLYKIQKSGATICRIDIGSQIDSIVVDQEGYIYTSDRDGYIKKIKYSESNFEIINSCHNISNTTLHKLDIDDDSFIYSAYRASGQYQLVKYNKDLEQLWIKNIEYWDDMKVDTNHNIYLSTSSKGKLIKMNAEGLTLWEKDADFITSLFSIDNDNNIYSSYDLNVKCINQIPYMKCYY